MIEATPAFGTEHQALGITRTTTETYKVGDYRYTSLSDAISQARRVASGSFGR